MYNHSGQQVMLLIKTAGSRLRRARAYALVLWCSVLIPTKESTFSSVLAQSLLLCRIY